MTRERAKRARTRPPQASGRVAVALWPQVAELRAEGKKASEIAAQLGRDVSAVCKTLKEPDVIAQIDLIIAERRQAAVHVLEAAAERMVRVLLDVAEDEGQQGGVRRAAASDALDRIGIVARKGIEVSGPNGGPVAVAVDVRQLAAMTPEQLRALALVHEDSPPDVDSAADSPAEDTTP